MDNLLGITLLIWGPDHLWRPDHLWGPDPYKKLYVNITLKITMTNY